MDTDGDSRLVVFSYTDGTVFCPGATMSSVARSSGFVLLVAALAAVGIFYGLCRRAEA